jgi:hypothetical protein
LGFTHHRPTTPDGKREYRYYRDPTAINTSAFSFLDLGATAPAEPPTAAQVQTDTQTSQTNQTSGKRKTTKRKRKTAKRKTISRRRRKR